ncbi:PREDICTED: UDP-glucuronosyltransferase 1-2-like [Branchiostoma belcheri]|uniref:UDP-glucuronosyltransferase n=1 Tax=Branchiostoma belcheri TaxID=7741 RepID=A0A6P4Y5U6_BRABE|nr:PREDICTED: UDP-glucuronosyltransferase 1-2-like [Branchiostoma belcheri]
MGMGPKLRCSSGVLLLVIFITHRSCSEKVLLVAPPRGTSHWMALADIGRALVDRGHIVTVVVAENSVAKRRAEWPDFQFETFQDQGVDARNYCALLLNDSNLQSRLRTCQYSVVISVAMFHCGAIVSAHLDSLIPHVVLTYGHPTHLDEKATGVPLPLSYVPLIGSDFTDEMTFLQRLENVVVYSLKSGMLRRAISSAYDELVRTYVGEEETLQSVTSRTELWLLQTDNLLHYPRPRMPNMVQVGGLNARVAAPLTEDMEKFVQSSGKDGVIVVSFGSMVETMSEDKREIFAAAFARLRQKVLWRYVGEKPAGLGDNTKLLGWLPQNDLLAHQKTRAFITHAGSNGLYEALHHGVPMVCLPLFWDQPTNAARVVARGLGVTLDFSTVTADQLYQAILHVLTNNSCRETAARLSRLHRDQPQSPMERAVWWIEHVIQHGGLPHLRARAVELPWYQYYLLDVAAFLLSVCAAVLGTVWFGCSLVCRKCCTRGGGKLKTQ